MRTACAGPLTVKQVKFYNETKHLRFVCKEPDCEGAREAVKHNNMGFVCVPSGRGCWALHQLI